MTGRLSFIRMTDDIYLNYPDSLVVGYYMNFGQPILLIRDQDIAKRIGIKDFDHFTDRRELELDKEENKIFMNMLISLSGKFTF